MANLTRRSLFGALAGTLAGALARKLVPEPIAQVIAEEADRAGACIEWTWRFLGTKYQKSTWLPRYGHCTILPLVAGESVVVRASINQKPVKTEKSG